VVLLWFAIGWLLGPVSGWAADNNCLDQTRRQQVSGPEEFPQFVLDDLGLKPNVLAKILRRGEVFSRSYQQTRADLKSLEYEYQLPVGERILMVETEFKSTYSYATNLFHLEKTYILIGPGSAPRGVLKSDWVYDSDCKKQQKTTTRTVFKYDGSESVKVERDSLNNGERKTEKFAAAKSELVNWYRLRKTTSYDETLAIPEVGNFGTMKVVLEEGKVPAVIRFQRAPFRHMYNPVDRKIEDFSEGFEAIFDAGGKTDVAHATIYKQGSYQVNESRNGDGTVDTQESIPADLWYESHFVLPTRHGPEMIGFEDSDLLPGKLIFTAEIPDYWRVYENIKAYFAVNYVNRDGRSLLYELTASSPRQPPPAAAPWRETGHSDQNDPYLRSTAFIELNALKDIAESMRPGLKGKNRLEVARAIIRKISTLIEFDVDMAADGAQSVEAVSQTLARKSGVCQHYSALFVAIARNLGIPSRIVVGYRLHQEEATGHDWVEFKINDKDWWPLEPQIDAPTLPRRVYYPTMVNPFYEVMNQEEMDRLENDFMAFPNVLKFTKISSDPEGFLDLVQDVWDLLKAK
jgi:transglutaminase-like putative cysteine protease